MKNFNVFLLYLIINYQIVQFLHKKNYHHIYYIFYRL